MTMTDDGRYVCTADAPWVEAKGGRAVHPDAKRVGEWYDPFSGAYPSYETFKCPHCGLQFDVEIGS